MPKKPHQRHAALPKAKLKAAYHSLKEGEVRFDAFSHVKTVHPTLGPMDKADLADVQYRIIGKFKGKLYVANLGAISKSFTFSHPALVHAMAALATLGLELKPELKSHILSILIDLAQIPILTGDDEVPLVYWAYDKLEDLP